MPIDVYDFLSWLGSTEGQLSQRALFAVMDSLENCSVDPVNRVIVWTDGSRLSIAQTARRIHYQSQLPLTSIESHVVGWLEMHYVPKSLDEQQMEQFENLIDAWIHDHECSTTHANPA
jgi:hypothetical protein